MRTTLRAARLALCLATFGLLVGAGCSSTGAAPARADTTRTVSVASTGSLWNAMEGVRTVSFHPTARIARAHEGSDASLQASVERAILDAFAAQGYRVAPPGQGQVLVAYGIGLSSEIDDAELREIFGFTPGIGSKQDELRGAMVIVTVHPRTGIPTWRSGASAEARAGLSSGERDAAIRRVTGRLLGSLPPAAR